MHVQISIAVTQIIDMISIPIKMLIVYHVIQIMSIIMIIL